MTSKTPALGVLTLERGASPNAKPWEPSPGSLFHPGTFGLPVFTEKVQGAWVDNVVRGDSTLEAPYVAAALRLVERGAIAISSDCGYSIRHQAAVAASVRVPVGMSSLLLLPGLLRSVPRSGKIAVITFDAAHSDENLLGIKDPMEQTRIVIGGIEGSTFWHNEMRRPPSPTETASIEADVVACVERLRAEHPEIRAVLLECTDFPGAAPALRRIENLPVYDLTHLCRLMLDSVR